MSDSTCSKWAVIISICKMVVRYCGDRLSQAKITMGTWPQQTNIFTLDLCAKMENYASLVSEKCDSGVPRGSG